jgi:hypothetical protein
MEQSQIRVGDRVLITTERGEEEATITRIVQGPVPAGVWVVETSGHGRVVIMPKRGGDGDAEQWS